MHFKLNSQEFTSFKIMAYILALAGVLPFLIGALVVVTKLSLSASFMSMMLAYSVIILAFLGGLHWGVAVTQQDINPRWCFWLLIESVAPAILGWLIVLINSINWQLNGLIALFIIVWLIDLGLGYLDIVPKWFLGLRTLITLLVSSLLLIVRLFHG